MCRRHHVILAPSIEPGASALVGFHGSWTSAEMLVPLAVLPRRELTRRPPFRVGEALVDWWVCLRLPRS